MLQILLVIVALEVVWFIWVNREDYSNFFTNWSRRASRKLKESRDTFLGLSKTTTQQTLLSSKVESKVQAPVSRRLCVRTNSAPDLSEFLSTRVHSCGLAGSGTVTLKSMRFYEIDRKCVRSNSAPIKSSNDALEVLRALASRNKEDQDNCERSQSIGACPLPRNSEEMAKLSFVRKERIDKVNLISSYQSHGRPSVRRTKMDPMAFFRGARMSKR